MRCNNVNNADVMFEITYETTEIDPEDPMGNVEYKFRIDADKIKKLKDQLRWRMNEGIDIAGFPEAYYYIGVSDDGKIDNRDENVVETSIDNFKKMTEMVGADIVYIHRHKTKSGYMAIIYVKKKIDSLDKNDTIITLLGMNTVGKSTFVGTLTHGMVDNAKGVARNNVLRHDHEYESGETSSTKYEIVGYTKDIAVNYTSSVMTSWYHIVNDSERVVNLVDLPGENKYTRLKLSSFLIYRPDFTIFFLDASEYQATIDIMMKFITVADKLGISYIIAITKVDLINKEEKKAIVDDIKVRSDEILKRSTNEITKDNLDRDGIHFDKVNYYFTSHLRFDDIKITHRMLNHLTRIKSQEKFELNLPTEFIITDIIYIADIGNVVIGVLRQGRISIGDKLMIGPIDGKFEEIKIRSIHKKQIPHTKITASNDICSVVISNQNKIINKHMSILGIKNPDELLVDELWVRLDSDERGVLEKNINSYVYLFVHNFIEKVMIHNISADEDSVMLKMQINSNRIFVKKGEKVIMKVFDDFYTGSIV